MVKIIGEGVKKLKQIKSKAAVGAERSFTHIKFCECVCVYVRLEARETPRNYLV